MTDKKYIIYNPYAQNGRCKQEAEILEVVYKNTTMIDIEKISSYKVFFEGLEEKGEERIFKRKLRILKGALFHYQPVRATVSVDGEKHIYENVWMAPTMNGRFYNGGLMPTPKQDRICCESLEDK